MVNQVLAIRYPVVGEACLWLRDDLHWNGTIALANIKLVNIKALNVLSLITKHDCTSLIIYFTALT